MKWPIYCTSEAPTVAYIRIDSASKATGVRSYGAAYEAEGTNTRKFCKHRIADIIAGDRIILTEAEALARVKTNDFKYCPEWGKAKNYVGDTMSLTGEVGRLRDELKEAEQRAEQAEATCVEYAKVLRDVEVQGDDSDAAKWCRDVLAKPNPGQFTLAELARLRKRQLELESLAAIVMAAKPQIDQLLIHDDTLHQLRLWLAESELLEKKHV